MTEKIDIKGDARIKNRIASEEMAGMETEERILLAAEQEFMAKGFTGARTTAIAEAAGVTHAMFHYYFRTKEKLFNRIISEKVKLLKEALLSSFDSSNHSLSETIQNVINRHLDFIATNPDLPRFIVGEVYSNPERCGVFIQQLQACAPTMLNTLQSMIDDTAAQGLCRRVDAKMLMLDIASLNIFSFMAAPIVNAALDDCLADTSAFVERRKKENYDTIMKKLQP